MGIFDRLRIDRYIREKRTPNKAVVDFNVLTSTRGSAGLSTIYTDEDFSKLMDIYRKVPDVYSSIELTIDQLIYTWFRVEGGEQSNNEKCQYWTESFNIQKFLRKFLRCLLVTGNAFLDVRFHPKMNVIRNIMIVDPDTIIIKRDKYAEKYLYFQRTIDNLEKPLPNLIHISMNNITDEQVYGTPDFASILTVLNAKLNMENDVVNITHNFAYPLFHWKLGTAEYPANPTSIKTFRNAINNLQGRDVVTGTDVQGEVLGGDALKIQTPVDHFQRQVVAGLRVPGFLLELPSESPESLRIQIDNYYRKCVRYASVTAKMLEEYCFAPMCNIRPDQYGYLEQNEWKKVPKVVWNDIETVQDKMLRISQLHGSAPMVSTDEARSQLGYEDDLTLSDSQMLDITGGATTNPKGKVDEEGKVGNPNSGVTPITPKSKATPSNARRQTVPRGKAKDIKKTNVK